MKQFILGLALLLSVALANAQNLDSINNSKNSAQTLIASKSGSLLMAAYGEVHYNHGFGQNTIQNGNLDVHRQVLLFGYKFNSRTSFITEIEIEHIKEVYLEQAFLNYQAKPWLNFQAGLLLIPFGIVNEYHEPTTFNGVERPVIDKVLIPTTWREVGTGITGNLTSSSLRYQLFLVNGPMGYTDEAKFNGDAPIRGGRQKGSEAVMRQPDLSAKLNYYGVRGLNLGASFYAGTSESELFTNLHRDSTAAMATADSSVIGVTMAGLDFRYQKKNFQARGQAIYGMYNNTIAYNGLTGKDLGSTAFGYYVEAGYNIGKMLKLKTKLVPFLRYSQYDTHFETKGELTKNLSYQKDIITTGFTYYIDDAFVAKADVQLITDGNNKKSNTANLGVGYWFR